MSGAPGSSSGGVDLHLHTTLSDGLRTPAGLGAAAREAGLELIAVTDHDELRGLPEVRAAAGDVRVLAGVEISCAVPGGGLHVLGYGVDPEDTVLVDLLRANRMAKRAQMAGIVRQMHWKGVSLDWEALAAERPGDAYIGRKHLERLLLAGPVRNKKTIYRRYLGRRANTFIEARVTDAATAIAAIHGAGGLAVLAHPSRENLTEHLPALCRSGLDGLELYRPFRGRRFLDEVASEAFRRKLFVTAGSDSHGDEERDPFGRFRGERERLTDFLARLEAGP